MNPNATHPNIDQDLPIPSMRFQARDGEILRAIYERGGVLARRQLRGLFWATRSARAMEKRLAKLHQAHFLAWPNREQRRSRPIPEPIVWLGYMGIGWVGGRSGIWVQLPTPANENQLRQIEQRLRRKGIHWLREPRWAQLEHDLAVVDFRLNIEKAVQAWPVLRLEQWVNEGTLHARPDVVEYRVKGKDGKPKRLRKRVSPDGYFALLDRRRPDQGSAARSRFVLEIDRATHDNPSFGREKVLPGIAYLLSPAYQQRFGDNSGRWLVVTTGERRMKNLKRQAEREAGVGASAFYFTTFDRVRPETVLTAPIWLRGGEERPVPLFYR